MSAEVRQFILDAIEDMNYPMDDVDADTSLGSAGVALESLAVAELAVRVEDKFGVKFADEEAEEISALTIGELADLIVSRSAAASQV